MEPTLRQELVPVQRQVMNLRQRQSLEILGLPWLSLKQHLEVELMENPLLEEVEAEDGVLSETDLLLQAPTEDGESQAEADERWTARQARVTRPASLDEHLVQQFRIASRSERDITIGEAIIGHLDENGYLIDTIDDVAHFCGASVAEVEGALAVLQSLDPPGVGARDLRGCLLIQLRLGGREGSLAWRLVHDHLDALGRRQFERLGRRLHVPLEQVREAAQEIARLNPKPGLSYRVEPNTSVIPDVVVTKEDDQLRVIVNDGELPKIRVHRHYAGLLGHCPDATNRAFLARRLADARGLVDAVRRRRQTLKRLVQELCVLQAEAMEHGLAALRPLTLRETATRVGLHEATVSRVVAGKYVQTPVGVASLRSFFSNGVPQDTEEVSSRRIRATLGALIRGEDKRRPLSDEDLVRALASQGLRVARRTVAKYRATLKILPSQLRKA